MSTQPGAQDELFPPLDAVQDPRRLDIDQRRALLDETYHKVMVANGGRYSLSAGPEADLMWDATMRSFEQGIWAGASMCAQAVCERTLASLLESWYALPPEPKGWRQRGLGWLIGHHREHGLVDADLLDQMQFVCDARKPFGHWRLPMGEGSLERVGYEAHVQGGHWREAQDVYVAKSAVLCAQTAIRTYFGDLWMRLPSRTFDDSSSDIK
ncbi:hypothetical protein K8Z61_16355 [Nocardioides sp. TRM66260-LWL]|uniref:hypothetical protein n=1 Tax=Nocardioides sp. TRM66260-LWL TaxID=2874478 RepID=UPI001CC6A974|nr:hypothetical protein [Nocardioides sp. TRM66260-LWL]MBZ5736068.1 hypothetical protein [Nocardioides sp. TRM66260-LWL]